MLKHSTALLVLLVLLADPVSAAGRVHALVIGIDDYHAHPQITPLDGAVADAQDIAAALRANKYSTSTVKLLLNHDAHRDAIFNAWQELKAAADPGDTLLLSYAGHGGQEPERISGQEQDGRDETLILGGFNLQPPHNRQRIFDDELRNMVAAATDYNVLMLFDSCNSGTANRTLQVSPFQRRTRAARYGKIKDDALPPPNSRAIPEPSPGALTHETFMAGAQDGNPVLEININDQPRGALSYFFARALRGDADLDSNSQLTRRELHDYLVTNVRVATEGLQQATVAFAADASETPLFATPGAKSTPTTTTTPSDNGKTAPATAQTTLKLALSDLGDTSSDGLYLRLRHVQAVPPANLAQADLIWSVENGRLISRLNDIVAAVERGNGPQAFAQVQGVIDKWRVLPALKQLAAARPLQLALDRGDGLHRRGTNLQLSIAPRRHAPLTILNLASTGTVQYLYPLQKYDDDPSPPPQQIFELFTIQVAEPFGADHVIALSGPGDHSVLRDELQRLDGSSAAAELLKLLNNAVADGSVNGIGLYGFYTAP